jgi:hypothetical protein
MLLPEMNRDANHLPMKRIILSCLILTGVILPPVALRAENFKLDWFTIDGGGGTSIGGRYSVSGTIAQPDAGQLARDGYTLSGGFWGAVPVIPPEPLLTIGRSGGSVVVKWPFPSSGFILQQTTALACPPSAILWIDVTSPGALQVGSDWTVTIPAPTGNRLLRLRKP